MTTLIFLLVGFAAGVAVAYGLLGLQSDKAEAPSPTPVPEPVETPAQSPTAEPGVEPLSAKLHRLSVPLEAFGDTTAHPRELSDRNEFVEATALLADMNVPLETVTQYALGANWTMSCAALAALAQRADGQQASKDVLAFFGRLRPWALHYALEYLSSLKQRPLPGAAVVAADSWWADNLIIPGLFRAYFTRVEKLGDKPKFGAAATASYASDPADIETFLKSLDHPFATALIADLKTARAAKLDRAFLEGFGRFWSKSDDLLIEPEEWKDLIGAAENALTRSPARSLIVSGDAKVGKSAFLRLLGDRLIAKGWTIFEAGGPELQAGQSYIGQLEERVRRMVGELTADKRAIWYVPDILQVAVSGTHHGQTASILDQVLPAITSGRLIIISEATPTKLTQLLQLRPNLKGVFEGARIAPLPEERAAKFVETYLETLTKESKVTFDSATGSQAMQLARQYLGTSELPGVVLDLVKLTFNRCAGEGAKTIGPADVLVTLSQVTGLPIAILDGNEKVELDEVRRFFDARVMGQTEAVAAVVDRIAMLKAGLTDHTKPIGVFLFAGPTGTGKTELAKTLAAFLFGSDERLIRLDMSEFKTPESLNKVIGDPGGGQTESLINRVRKQPFSVVLLDEFEKAHGNVWDLFLQVFDDGRLSDGIGNVADFRHCIIILTSNLGATSHQAPALGFGAKAASFSSEQIMQAIGQAFRPEFVNRLDKVIVFQPLRRDLMRQILQKELRNVLERRGLRNREWAVEWENSALEFLLDRGFSPELGARPLKRAIDQYLLAPLAATIVEHRFPEGDQFLFVRSDGKAIQVEFVDPDAETAHVPTAPSAGGVSLAEIVHNSQGSAAERAVLESEYRALAARLDGEAWNGLAAQLSGQMAEPAFWSRADRHGVLARYALMDRVKAATQTIESLRERLDKSRDARGHSSEVMGRLARQIFVTGMGVEDALNDAPIEAVLSVEPALEGSADAQAARAWCAQVLKMYRGWAAKRGMQIDDYAMGNDAVLTVSGFGAYRLLAEEVGLHVLEAGDDDESSRVIARVRVAAAPPGDLPAASAAKTLRATLERAGASNTVVRRYRGGASPLVRDGKKAWRSGKFDAVLAGDFDVIGATAAR
jgi:ATP-dependent Clp protease ATP-binding subunit ClpC